MVRIIAALLAGLLVGIAATYFAFDPDSTGVEREVVRDIAEVPKMSQAAATEHREKNYAELTTIEQIYSLPTAFARAEALYQLAGRSDSAQVQNLIFAANRIADEMERYGALRILFMRLAEMDPHSALALSRTEFFRGVRMFEQTVWQAWARMDLDDALFAAKTQTTRSAQNMAAQSLYMTFGFMGNETTDRIESELGIAPDRSTRSRFLYLMVDRSPAEAIAYINSMPRGAGRQEFIWWLAYYLSSRDANGAMEFASLFETPAEQQGFREMIQNSVARDDPTATIDEILASGQMNRRLSEFYVAFGALVQHDVDRAMQYFDEVQSHEHRQSIGSVIARELAGRDPERALRWTRENTGGNLQYLETIVLAKIAETDPELAFAEAQNAASQQMRGQMVSSVISQLAQSDPSRAIGYLGLIQDDDMRDIATAQLATNWIQQDPDAALAWILGQDDPIVATLLEQSSWALIQSDVDAAIQVLPRLDQTQQQHWRMQIAQQLAATRSPGDAQAFVRRFEGEPGYEQLQSGFISALAQSDPVRAQQMADQLTETTARDSAYAQIISVRAQRDPQAAAAMLSSIADENYRSMATGQVASHWYGNDPSAAMSWVSRLSDGVTRDDAIMHLASNWSQPTREQAALVNSIRDDDKRGQAKITQAYNLMRTDPAAARELLQDPDIPSHQREQAEMAMKNFGNRY